MSDSGSPPASPSHNADEIKLAPASNEAKLFVRPVRFETTQEDVERIFSSAGTISELLMMRGYAFVTFSTPEEAQRAKETLSGTDINGEPLVIEFSKEKKEDTRGKFRVKVTQLPEGTAWQDFKDFVREKTTFSPTFAKVFRDYELGETIGNLEFSAANELEKAIDVLNQADYEGSVITAEVDTSPFVPPPRREGGFRGGRGDFRGGRGGRGGRGDFRGGRGGFRGGRGRDDGFRGGRGGFRGGRGGYDRDNNRGGYERDSYVRDRSPTRY